jgi:hypothetical protein
MTKNYNDCKAIINEKKGNDAAIDQLFISFKIFFEDDEENPISNISKETKFGDILDEVCSIENLTTFRDVIENTVTTNSITYKLKNSPMDIKDMFEKVKYARENVSEKIDATPTIEFFSALTIKDICSYRNERIGLY